MTCVVVASTKRPQARARYCRFKNSRKPRVDAHFYILQGKRHELLARSFPDMSARFFFRCRRVSRIGGHDYGRLSA